MIRIHDLHKRFGVLHVLRGASMTVAKGEVAVLIGASGSGKSTLLRCINGLETYDHGLVEVDGLAVQQPKANGDAAGHWSRLRRRVGMVFQQFNLFPHMTALENVMAGPRYVLDMDEAAAADRARSLLARVGLAEKINARPSTLSGGQQQRVAIARTLANEPDVILFDEPTSALDPRMTGEVLAVMADLAASGQTMIVVSHAMGFVRRSAHNVHVFHEGRIVESGPPERIFDGAQHAATREFLKDTEA